jgi:tRNA A37 threonylcarbamoyladenosine dehydratase
MIDLAAFDAAADCVDTITAKLLLAKIAASLPLYLLSCMGTGNRLDPGRLRITDIYQTSVCPLARRMRKACREAQIPALRVLYSDEEPVQAIVGSENGRHIPGSVSFVPPVAGMIMAGSIIQHLVRSGQDRLGISQEPS